MLKFKSLTVQNFMSYGAIPTTIQLDNPGTIFIMGEDLDHTSGGTGANGVGKTALLINGLSYACYDRPISDMNLDELINWTNLRNMIVAVNFEKDSDDYVVTRHRKVKAGAGGTFTTFTKNGKPVVMPAGSDGINAEIERVIGIPYELFIRIVTFSANHTPFLNLPVRHASQANQSDIIEELFGLKTLSEKAELLKKEIKTTELALKTNIEKQDIVEKDYERHLKQLETAKVRVQTWDTNKANEIIRLLEQENRLETINVPEQRTILEELERIEDNLEKAIQEQQRWNTEVIACNKKLKEHTHELEHLNDGKCPYCEQKFYDEKKWSNAEFFFTCANDGLKTAKEKLVIADEEVKKQTLVYKQVKSKLVVKNLEQLLQLDNNIKTLNDKIFELQTTVNPHIESLQELEAIQFEKKDMTVINELKVTLDHQTFLLKLLTKKDSFVRKALLNKHLPYLNKRLQLYLTDIGLPFNVEFTHDMTAKISQFAHEASFGQLSNGQRARVNIALSFAFRDVLQSMYDHINICLLDEVLDVGLDTVGINAVAKMLKRKARDEKLAIYIISHRDEIDSAFDRKMIISLSGGFSSVRYEDE